jgi:hypothetical protein
MELILDQPLLQAVRTEAMQTFAVDELTGQRQPDIQKLASMPLLTAVYTEVLRMHISFTATRETLRDIELDGYHIAKGCLVQSPSQIAHYDESVWGTAEYPASVFWAGRHLLMVSRKTEKEGEIIQEPHFSVKSRPASFFPYGNVPIPTTVLPPS